MEKGTKQRSWGDGSLKYPAEVLNPLKRYMSTVSLRDYLPEKWKRLVLAMLTI